MHPSSGYDEVVGPVFLGGTESCYKDGSLPSKLTSTTSLGPVLLWAPVEAGPGVVRGWSRAGASP